MNSHKTSQIWKLIWVVLDWVDVLEHSFAYANVDTPAQVYQKVWANIYIQNSYLCPPTVYCSEEPDNVITMYLQSHIYLAKYLIFTMIDGIKSHLVIEAGARFKIQNFCWAMLPFQNLLEIWHSHWVYTSLELNILFQQIITCH